MCFGALSACCLGGDLGESMCLEWEVELQRVRRTAIDAPRKHALSARSGRRGRVNLYMRRNRVPC